MELLLVGLGTGFAMGVGLATWLASRLAAAERRANVGRGTSARVERLLAWEGDTVSVRGTVPVTQEAQRATVSEG